MAQSGILRYNLSIKWIESLPAPGAVFKKGMKMKKLDRDGLAILKQLVSDVQGAPFPHDINNELYYIWYEHAQRIAIQCLEYLDHHFPDAKNEGIPKF